MINFERFLRGDAVKSGDSPPVVSRQLDRPAAPFRGFAAILKAEGVPMVARDPLVRGYGIRSAITLRKMTGLNLW